MGKYKNPEIIEAVAGCEDSGAGLAVESVTRQPSISEVTLGYVLGGLLGPGSWSLRSRDARRGRYVPSFS